MNVADLVGALEPTAEWPYHNEQDLSWIPAERWSVTHHFSIAQGWNEFLNDDEGVTWV